MSKATSNLAKSILELTLSLIDGPNNMWITKATALRLIDLYNVSYDLNSEQTSCIKDCSEILTADKVTNRKAVIQRLSRFLNNN